MKNLLNHNIVVIIALVVITYFIFYVSSSTIKEYNVETSVTNSLSVELQQDKEFCLKEPESIFCVNN